MMGLDFYNTTNVLADNMSVVINMQFPTSSIKKKHNSLAFHKTREAIAAQICQVGYIYTDTNVSDILTKPKSPKVYNRLLKGPLY